MFLGNCFFFSWKQNVICGSKAAVFFRSKVFLWHMTEQNCVSLCIHILHIYLILIAQSVSLRFKQLWNILFGLYSSQKYEPKKCIHISIFFLGSKYKFSRYTCWLPSQMLSFRSFERLLPVHRISFICVCVVWWFFSHFSIPSLSIFHFRSIVIYWPFRYNIILSWSEFIRIILFFSQIRIQLTLRKMCPIGPVNRKALVPSILLLLFVFYIRIWYFGQC